MNEWASHTIKNAKSAYGVHDDLPGEINESIIVAKASVLQEAEGLIYGDRKAQYGNARDNFSDIGALWAPIIGRNIGPEAVALCLLQLKVARALNDVREARPVKRDTIVDLAGYAGLIEQIQDGE